MFLFFYWWIIEAGKAAGRKRRGEIDMRKSAWRQVAATAHPSRSRWHVWSIEDREGRSQGHPYGHGKGRTFERELDSLSRLGNVGNHTPLWG